MQDRWTAERQVVSHHIKVTWHHKQQKTTWKTRCTTILIVYCGDYTLELMTVISVCIPLMLWFKGTSCTLRLPNKINYKWIKWSTLAINKSTLTSRNVLQQDLSKYAPVVKIQTYDQSLFKNKAGGNLFCEIGIKRSLDCGEYLVWKLWRHLNYKEATNMNGIQY